MNETVARIGVIFEALTSKGKKIETGGGGVENFKGTPDELSKRLNSLGFQTRTVYSEGYWQLKRNDEVIKLGEFEIGGLMGCGVEMDKKTMELIIKSLK